MAIKPIVATNWALKMQALGEIDRLVAIFLFQITLIREEICDQQPFYLSYAY